MSELIEKWNEQRDGPLTEQALRDKLEQRGYQVSRYVYPPGTVFPLHSHAVDKIDAVLSGRFRMTLHDEECVLSDGDCLALPAGTQHSAAVIGDDNVVSLDAIKL